MENTYKRSLSLEVDEQRRQSFDLLEVTVTVSC